MIKLNWRDASKELPENENCFVEYSKFCLVIIKETGKAKRIEKAFLCFGVWESEKCDKRFSNVTHWIYEEELLLTNKEARK